MAVLFFIGEVDEEDILMVGGDVTASVTFALEGGSCWFGPDFAPAVLLLAANSVESTGGGTELGDLKLDEDEVFGATSVETDTLAAPLGADEGLSEAV